MKYIYLLASLFLVFTLPAQVEYNTGGLTAALDSIYGPTIQWSLAKSLSTISPTQMPTIWLFARQQRY